MKNPNGPSIEQIEEWLEMQQEQFEAQADPRVQNAKCTVCKAVWVDVLNGEDTCADCLRRA